MIKRVCDRCGKEMNTDPMVQCQNPLYKIEYINPPGIAPIDLCEKCSKAFGFWLKVESEDKG